MTDRPVPVLTPAGNPPESPASRSGTRKKASTACSACRARRSKCSSSIPCLSCISHRTECIKDENEDGRRRVAMKRRLDSLEEDRVTLDNLTTALKYGSPPQIQSLQNFIQLNTSREDLRVFLEENMKFSEEGSPKSIEPPGSPLIGRRFKTGGIGELINPPIQVPAQPWTKATQDNDFVSHLISLWFTWAQPWFRWIEEGPFIEAMQSQDLSNPFCSPGLVNSILAQACLFDAPDLREDGYSSRLQERFTAEASAEIDAEQAQGKTSLTMIQAVGVGWTTYLNGDGLRGRLALNSQVVLIKELYDRRSRASASPPDLMEKVDRFVNFVEWAIFTMKSYDLTDYRNLNRFGMPLRGPLCFGHDNAPETTWSSYPISRGSPPSFHPDCHLRSLVDLAQKTAENEELSLRREQGFQNESWLRNLVQSLQDWPSMLPLCMQLHPQAMPHVLVLHALYNWTMLVSAKQAAAAQAGQATQPIIAGTHASPEAIYWQRVSTTRAVTIAGLMKSYTRNWSSDYFPPMVLQPISLALLTLLEDLNGDDNKPAFISLSNSLILVRRKFRVAAKVLQAVRQVADSKGIHLPAEVEHIYEEHTSDVEGVASGSSQQRAEHGSPEIRVVADYLLQKWQDLKLDDEDE